MFCRGRARELMEGQASRPSRSPSRDDRPQAVRWRRRRLQLPDAPGRFSRQRRDGGALADYYAARGNLPGVWLGKGAEQLGVAGGEVTEAQMRALFGQGLHPDAEAMLAAGAPARATKLGAAYPTTAPRSDCSSQRLAPEWESLSAPL